ncbi:MAG: lysophospholipid acyltransferase family protein [bacterium]
MSEDTQLHGQPSGILWTALPSIMETLIAPAFRAWGNSWNLQVSGQEHLATARRKNRGILLATWHGSLAGFVFTMRDQGVVGLVSPVWEGELIARWLSGLGYGLVRGSSGHQSTEGLRASVRALKQGRDVGTVVDGPEGPAKVVKSGVISIAKLAGVPIVPALAAGSLSYRFPNWDRHELPLLFSRVRFGFAEPLVVPRNANEEKMEEFRATLERRLIALDTTLRLGLNGRSG